jgi:Protein of unknown function with PCYCGC motif
MLRLSRRRFLHAAALLLAAPVTTDEIGDQVQTLPAGQLPDFAGPAPHIRQAYRFAAERGADLAFIPCYCGCGRFGHQHNGDCYIKTRHPDGRITFTSHAAT